MISAIIFATICSKSRRMTIQSPEANFSLLVRSPFSANSFKDYLQHTNVEIMYKGSRVMLVVNLMPQIVLHDKAIHDRALINSFEKMLSPQKSKDNMHSKYGFVEGGNDPYWKTYHVVRSRGPFNGRFIFSAQNSEWGVSAVFFGPKSVLSGVVAYRNALSLVLSIRPSAGEKARLMAVYGVKK